MSLVRCLLVCGLTLGAACAAEEPQALAGNAPCEKWVSLSRIMGCDVAKASDVECSAFHDQCSDLANAWIECAARDKAQCYCEPSDNSLNCEGSFKADEGPANCFEEYRALAECENP